MNKPPAGLLDVSALVALVWPNHEFHARIARWMEKHGRKGWATCALTELGLARLSLNPVVTGGLKVTADAVRQILNQLRAQPGHRYINELPSPASAHFMEVFEKVRGHQMVTDAYLLGLAQHSGCKLVTFDSPLAEMSPWPGRVEVLL